MKRTVILALLAAAFVLLLSSVALAAKLVCVSHQDIKAEMSVDKCLAQGMEFAIMDDNGFIRILSSREIELTKKFNPKAFETPGYGLKHYRMAPEIPPLPVSPEAG
ncbi:MAG: succinylglutamate desuccinylase [Pseudomonadota bacterium]